uniref:Uncharacterized protein n=1 Tax=Anguilla anguilla TaxID=7936 RepID=A0A0E9RPU5_ANGAN
MKSKAGLSSCLLQVYIDEFSCENIHVQTGQNIIQSLCHFNGNFEML